MGRACAGLARGRGLVLGGAPALAGVGLGRAVAAGETGFDRAAAARFHGVSSLHQASLSPSALALPSAWGHSAQTRSKTTGKAGEVDEGPLYAREPLTDTSDLSKFASHDVPDQAFTPSSKRVKR